MSKKDLGKRKSILRKRLDDLLLKAKMDPLKKNKELHYEIEQLNKKMAEDN
ncbi:MAG: hypothetical protein AABX38_01535 [Candidatus Micrarchaeota archaeon]